MHIRIYPSIFIAGEISGTRIYLFTEDAKLGTFDKLPSRKGPCQTKYILRGRRQSHVGVGRRTGVLTLRRYPRSLRKDSRGIRKLTIHIQVTKRCHYGRQPYNAPITVSVKLMIFPVNFGDKLVRNSARRISARIRQNNVFRNAAASSLLRVVRFVTRKIESRAFDKMLASIKVMKTLEFVIKEIVKRYVTKNKSEFTLTLCIHDIFNIPQWRNIVWGGGGGIQKAPRFQKHESRAHVCAWKTLKYRSAVP